MSHHAQQDKTLKLGIILVVVGVVCLIAAAFLVAGFMFYDSTPATHGPVAVAGPTNVVAPNRSVTANAKTAGSVTDGEQFVTGEPYVVSAGRIPFPKVGEEISKPLPAKRLGPDESAPPPKPGEIVPWERAGNYLNQEITVQGKIVRTAKVGKVVFLNFHEEWRGKFYLVLFTNALEYVEKTHGEPAEKFFLNKTIRITGTIRSRSSTPQIQVRNGARVKVIE